MEQLSLLDMQTIHSQLPLIVGDSGIAGLRIPCPKCQTEISQEDFVGEVQRTSDYGHIIGQASCLVCGHVASVEFDCDDSGCMHCTVDGCVMLHCYGRGIRGWLAMASQYLILLWVRFKTPGVRFSFRVRHDERRNPLPRPDLWSENVLGRYLDVPIHEWVELADNRYHFECVIKNFDEWIVELPEGEVAIWPGLLYRQKQVDETFNLEELVWHP